jgi:hypothetical protein
MRTVTTGKGKTRPDPLTAALEELLVESNRFSIPRIHDEIKGRLDLIVQLRAANVPVEKIAHTIAAQIDADPATVQKVIASLPPRKSSGRPGRPRIPFSANPTPIDLPVVPAQTIQNAIALAMKKLRRSEFSLRETAVVNEIMRHAPELKDLPLHLRNRKIIDACINRRIGPQVRTTSEGRRVIWLPSRDA